MEKDRLKELFLIKFDMYGNEHYAFWYTGDMDRFLLNKNKKIRNYKTENEAKLFAKREGYRLDEEITFISLDIFQALKMEILDCNLVLTYWNLLSDAAHSVNSQFWGDNQDEDTQNIYRKLFYGCNLPAMKMSGQDFCPDWNKEEKKRIVAILENGFKNLYDALN